MKKKVLTLSRTTVRNLQAKSLDEVAGGPGHGTTNRCYDWSWTGPGGPYCTDGTWGLCTSGCTNMTGCQYGTYWC